MNGSPKNNAKNGEGTTESREEMNGRRGEVLKKIRWELEEKVAEVESLMDEIENLEQAYTHRFRNMPQTEMEWQSEANLRTPILEKRRGLAAAEKALKALIAAFLLTEDAEKKNANGLRKRLKELDEKLRRLEAYLQIKYPF